MSEESTTTPNVSQEVSQSTRHAVAPFQRRRERSLFTRHPGNPLLTAADWPYACNSVFNPGVTRLHNGSTLLLCRVEDHRGHSHFASARSKDGLHDWQIDGRPCMMPD